MRMSPNYKQERANDALCDACIGGDFKMVKSLLNGKHRVVKAEIKCSGNKALLYACYYGHLEIVKYLIESDDLTIHAEKSLGGKNGDILEEAFCSGSIALLSYLLQFKEISDRITENSDHYIQVADRYFMRTGYKYIVNFLVMDMGLHFSDSLIENEELSKYTYKLINSRELARKLQNNLADKEEAAPKRVKI